jgi:dipeptidase D
MEQVIKYFEEISKIPRASGNEKGISDYLAQYAKTYVLEAAQDDVFNIIIKKPASPGYENAPTVVLQGHLDMVCVKSKDKVHDFNKDPITFKYIGDMIYADDTTLGADNGIAMAYVMAIIASKDIKHPALEILLTSSEENNMTGAEKVNLENLAGKILVNMDATDEGMLVVGCAGAVKTTTTIQADWQKPQNDWEPFIICVNGLLSGHSGEDINRGRGNAIKLLSRVLNKISQDTPLQIAQINGGVKSSLIPNEAEAVILLPVGRYPDLQKTIKDWDEIFKSELNATDPGVTVSVLRTDAAFDKVMSTEHTKKVLEALLTLPDGVQTMDKSFANMVQSSTNLGVVSTTEKGVVIDTLIRSSVDSLKDYIKEQSYSVANLVGADFSEYAGFNAWKYNKNSRVLEACKKVYQAETGKEPEIKITHGGVECALFGERIKDLDMICFAPDIYECHTINEHVSKSSMIRTYDYLLKVLEAIN